MPIYSYLCPGCGERYYDWQHTYTGSRDIKCEECDTAMGRDYHDERAAVMPDWEPGHNPGIDYNYKNKADLMGEIKRRGLYPSVHGGGIHSSRANSGLYGDEEFRETYSPSKPEREDEETRS